MWAAGCIFHEILFGDHFLADIWDMDDIRNTVLKTPYTIPNGGKLAGNFFYVVMKLDGTIVDQSVEELLHKLFQKNPDKRISIEELLVHPVIFL